MQDQISNLLNPNEIQNIKDIDAALAKADETLLKLIQSGAKFAINPDVIKSLTDFNNSMTLLTKTSQELSKGVSDYQALLTQYKIKTEEAKEAAIKLASAEKALTEQSKRNSAERVNDAKTLLEEQKKLEIQSRKTNAEKLNDARLSTEQAKQNRINAQEQRALRAENERLQKSIEKKNSQAEKEASLFNQLSQQYKQAAFLAKELAVEYVLLEQKIKAATNPSQKQLLQNQLSGLSVKLKAAQANAIGLSNTINAVNASVGQHQTKVGNYTGAISGYFNNLKSQFLGFTGTMIGFFAILSKIREGVKINAELSDAFADLKIRIHGTNEDVQNLVGTLRQLDTRSSLTSLVDIAAIIAKKGVAKEEIAGVTKAVDDLMIAVGKEMGDPHEAVSSLVKLSTIYNDDKNVTAKKITDIGNAIQKLTSSGIATGKYLTDFAEQMGGIRGVTHMGIDSVLGLGAALEALGQSAHVSSTALSQVIVKLFTEQQKYADLTKNSLGDFQKMLHDDVLGTLLLVGQAIKGDAGEMEHFFEGMVDMQAKGYRAVGVIGDLASAIPFAKQQMEKATVAMKEQNRTLDAANEKQHTFAATIDRIGKSFEMAASQQSFMSFLDGIGKSIIFLIQHIPELLALGTLLIINWAAQNTALVLLRAQLIGYNIALFAYRVALGAVTVIQTAYTIGVAAMTGAIKLATAAQWLWNTAIKGTVGWVGALVAILTFVVAAFEVLALSLYKSTAELKAHGNQLIINAQILEKVNEETADTTQKIKTLTSIVKDNTVSLDIRNKALKDLIAIAPEYLSSLTLENLKMSEGTAILDKYIESLRAKAALEAAQKQESEIVEKDVQLQNVEMSLEKKRAQGLTYKSDVEKELKKLSEMDIVGKFQMNNPSLTYIDWLLKKTKEARADLKKELDITDEIVKDRYKKNAAFNPKKEDAAVMGVENDFNRINNPVNTLNKLKLPRLKMLKESVEKEYDSLTASAEDLVKSRILTDYYDEVQKRIDLIEGKQSKGGGLRNNGLTRLQKNLDGEKKLIEASERLNEQHLKTQLEREKEITDDIKKQEQERLDAAVRYTEIKDRMSMDEFRKEFAVQDQLIKQSLEKEKGLQFRLSELKSGRGNMRASQRKAYIDEVQKEITNEEKLRQSYVVNQETALNKYRAEFTQNQINHGNTVKRIKKEEEAEYLKSRELEFSQQQQVEIQGFLKQEFLLKEQFERGLLSHSQYYNKLKKLKEDQQTQSINVEVDFYKAILDEEKLIHRMSLEELRDYQKRYDAALQRKFDDENNKKPKKSIGRPTDFIVDAIVAGKGTSDDDVLRAKKDYWNKTVDLAKTAYDSMKIMRDNDFQQQQINLDRERRTLEIKSRQKVRAIQAEAGFEISKNNKIALIEAQTAAKEDELNAKSNELSLQKAIADKQNAQLEIVANTGTAIMATYAAYAGIPGGTLIATGIAGLLTGIGAAQYAAVSSTPLPQYWMGTGSEGTTSPYFTAGERGFELIQPVGKPAYFSSDTTKVYNEPLGTKISSHEQTVRLIQYAVGNVINQPNVQEKDIAKEIGRIIGDKFDEATGDFAYAVAKSRPMVNIYGGNKNDNLTWKIGKR
jgi:TP901 family phage tail tape measure protein